VPKSLIRLIPRVVRIVVSGKPGTWAPLGGKKCTAIVMLLINFRSAELCLFIPWSNFPDFGHPGDHALCHASCLSYFALRWPRDSGSGSLRRSSISNGIYLSAKKEEIVDTKTTWTGLKQVSRLHLLYCISIHLVKCNVTKMINKTIRNES